MQRSLLFIALIASLSASRAEAQNSLQAWMLNGQANSLQARMLSGQANSFTSDFSNVESDRNSAYTNREISKGEVDQATTIERLNQWLRDALAADSSYRFKHSTAGKLGRIADAFVPVATIASMTERTGHPLLAYECGHCPISYMNPEGWFNKYFSEESGPKRTVWAAWTQAVETVLKSREHYLRHARGKGCIHVIVNPDGSVGDVSLSKANNEPFESPTAVTSLRQVVSSIGSFPSFPEGSEVPAFHIILSAI